MNFPEFISSGQSPLVLLILLASFNLHAAEWKSKDYRLLKVENGQVVESYLYPAPVKNVEVHTDHISLELVSNDGTSLKIQHDPEFLGRGPWSSFTKAHMERRSELPDVIHELEAIDKAAWREAIPELVALQVEDPTDPMPPLYRALGRGVLGESDKIGANFERAEVLSTHWVDALALCGVAERLVVSHGFAESRAQQACEKVLPAFEKTGMRPDFVWNLVIMVVVTHDLRAAMQAAVNAGDAKSADRIASRFEAFFPGAEGSPMAWGALSDWLAANQMPEEAKAWKARADELKESPSHRLFQGQTRRIDLALLVLSTFGFVMVLVGFASGRASALRNPTREGLKRWIVAPSLPEVLGVLVFLGFVGWATHEATRGVSEVGIIASAPLGALQQGYSDPEVITWLEGLMASPERDEFLKVARAEQDSLVKGTHHTEVLPSAEAFAKMVRAHADATKSSNPLAIFQMVSAIDAPSKGERGLLAQVSGPFFLSLSAFPLLLIFFVLGRQAAFGFGPTSRVFYLVPASSAGMLAALVAFLFVAPLLYLLTPVGSILTDIAIPSVNKFYGLEGVGMAWESKPDKPWFILVLIASLVIHSLTTWFLVRRPAQ